MEFTSMENFTPAHIATTIPQIAQLLETRANLNDLLAKLEGNEKLNDLLAEVVLNSKVQEVAVNEAKNRKTTNTDDNE
jgi:type VI secretion system protein ImpB